MISKMGITDSHILCVVASYLNEPELRLTCEDALVEIVIMQIWLASANPAMTGDMEPQSQATRYLSHNKGKSSIFTSRSSINNNTKSPQRQSTIGGAAQAAQAANR